MEINQAFVHDILVVEGRPQLLKMGKNGSRKYPPLPSIVRLMCSTDPNDGWMDGLMAGGIEREKKKVFFHFHHSLFVLLCLQLLPGRPQDDRAFRLVHYGSVAGIAEDSPETGRGAQTTGRPATIAQKFSRFRQRGQFTWNAKQQRRRLTDVRHRCGLGERGFGRELS